MDIWRASGRQSWIRCGSGVKRTPTSTKEFLTGSMGWSLLPICWRPRRNSTASPLRPQSLQLRMLCALKAWTCLISRSRASKLNQSKTATICKPAAPVTPLPSAGLRDQPLKKGIEHRFPCKQVVFSPNLPLGLKKQSTAKASCCPSLATQEPDFKSLCLSVCVRVCGAWWI